MKKQERLAPFPREPTGTLASVRYDPCTVYTRHTGWPRRGDDRVRGDRATGFGDPVNCLWGSCYEELRSSRLAINDCWPPKISIQMLAGETSSAFLWAAKLSPIK
jgi:hypothetical protein